MNCVSCDICVYHLGLFAFFSGVFLTSRMTGARPVTTDFIMRVALRTTTTTATTTTNKDGTTYSIVFAKVVPGIRLFEQMESNVQSSSSSDVR